MNSFPRNRKFFATVNLWPFNLTPFDAEVSFDHARDCFVAEDKPTNGLPSLGMIPVNVLRYLW